MKRVRGSSIIYASAAQSVGLMRTKVDARSIQDDMLVERQEQKSHPLVHSDLFEHLERTNGQRCSSASTQQICHVSSEAVLCVLNDLRSERLTIQVLREPTVAFLHVHTDPSSLWELMNVQIELSVVNQPKKKALSYLENQHHQFQLSRQAVPQTHTRWTEPLQQGEPHPQL